MATPEKIFIDRNRKQLLRHDQGRFNPVSAQSLLEASSNAQIPIEIYPIERQSEQGYEAYNSSGYESVAYGTTDLRVTVGPCGTCAIQAGTFKLTHNATDTEEIDAPAISADVIERSLNTLASIRAAGSVQVKFVGINKYVIEGLANGVMGAITASEISLVPDSIISIVEVDPGTATTKGRYMLTIRPEPYANLDTWAAVTAASIAITEETTGSASQYEMQRVTISGPIDGGFWTLHDGGTYTSPLSADASASDVEDAVNAILGVGMVTVTKPVARQWDIRWTSLGAKTDLVVTGGLDSYSGISGTLQLNTTNLAAAVEGAGSVTASFQIIETISGTEQRMIYEEEINIYEEVLSNADLTTITYSLTDQATFDNDADRAATAPDYIGQLGVQIDTGNVYRAIGTEAGDWQLVTKNIYVSSVEQLSAAIADGEKNIIINGDVSVAANLTISADINLGVDASSGGRFTISNTTGAFTTDFGTDDNLTSAGHGLINGQTVFLSGDDLPMPLQTHQRYHVVNRTADTFALSKSAGGAEIELTDDGSGAVRNLDPTDFDVFAAEVVSNLFPWDDDDLVTFTTDSGDPPDGVNEGQDYWIVHLKTDEFSDAFINYTTDVITALSQFEDGQRVRLTVNSGSAPGGLVDGGLYYIVNISPGQNEYQLEATVGGGVIDLTDPGEVSGYILTKADRFHISDEAGGAGVVAFTDQGTGTHTLTGSGGTHSWKEAVTLTVNATPMDWANDQQVFYGDGTSSSTTFRQVEGTFGGCWRRPEWFGAVKDDGAYDNRDAIESAFKATTWKKTQGQDESDSSCMVQFQSGNYYVLRAVNVLGFNGQAVGTSRSKTIILAGATFDFTNSEKWETEDHPTGVYPVLAFGSSAPRSWPENALAYESGASDNHFRFIYFRHDFVGANFDLTCCVIAPWLVQENTAFEKCVFQGGSAYQLCLGSYDGSSVDAFDCNGIRIEQCEFLGVSRLESGIICHPIKISAGRFVEFNNCTIIGRYLSTGPTATFTTDFATDNRLTSAAHGILDGHALTLSSTGNLPAGMEANVLYYAINTTTNDFELSLTSGGAAVPITDDGTLVHSWSAMTVCPRTIDSKVRDLAIRSTHIESGVVLVHLDDTQVSAVSPGRTGSSVVIESCDSNVAIREVGIKIISEHVRCVVNMFRATYNIGFNASAPLLLNDVPRGRESYGYGNVVTGDTFQRVLHFYARALCDEDAHPASVPNGYYIATTHPELEEQLRFYGADPALFMGMKYTTTGGVVQESLGPAPALQAVMHAYYRMEEAAGAARVDEVAANNLTENGTVAQDTGIDGNCMATTTNADYLTSAAAVFDFDGTADWSFLCWVRHNDLTGTHFILGKTGVGDGGYAFSSVGDRHRVAYYNSTTTANIFASPTTTLVVDTWYLIYGGYDTSLNTIFCRNVNDWEYHEAVVTHEDISVSATDFAVGRIMGSALDLDGDVDELAVFSRLLTLDEIAWAFHHGMARTYADYS